MGADGRSWAGWFSLLALVILLAFLGPESIGDSAVAELAEIRELPESAATPATVLVVSR